jgi:hypothetical protein
MTLHPKLRWAVLSAALVAVSLVLVRAPEPARAAPDDKDPPKVFVGYLF